MTNRSRADVLADRIASLSEEDAIVVARWRDEIGAARFHAIMADLGAVKKNTQEIEKLQRRWPLFLAMAEEIRRSKHLPHSAAARRVAGSPAGLNEAQASNIQRISLEHYLRSEWSKHRRRAIQEIEVREHRQNSQTNRLNAVGMSFRVIEEQRRLFELVQQLKTNAVPANVLNLLSPLMGFNREPFPGYRAAMDLARTDPMMRLAALISSRDVEKG